MLKRLLDMIVSIVGLLLVSPLLGVIAVAVALDSRGPVFFRQERVGLRGRIFRIHKFRTMCVDAERIGRQVTVDEDPRITTVGRVLRRYKLDELPQLIDVLVGNMSLVGPRPEVPAYVSLYPSEIRDTVLSVRPGITDEASIEFRHESRLLANQVDPEAHYRKVILPRKLQLYERYAISHSVWGDVVLMGRTLSALFRD